nr:MAG TPA: hypothetical protein [Caudoviricetes sp.]
MLLFIHFVHETLRVFFYLLYIISFNLCLGALPPCSGAWCLCTLR